MVVAWIPDHDSGAVAAQRREPSSGLRARHGQHVGRDDARAFKAVRTIGDFDDAVRDGDNSIPTRVVISVWHTCLRLKGSA